MENVKFQFSLDQFANTEPILSSLKQIGVQIHSFDESTKEGIGETYFTKYSLLSKIFGVSNVSPLVDNSEVSISTPEPVVVNPVVELPSNPITELPVEPTV